MRLILALLLLFPNTIAFCSPFVKLGGNIDTDLPFYNNKMLTLGIQRPLYSTVFDYQFEAGYFVDNSVPGGLKTVFASPSIGVSIVNPSYYVKIFAGPAIVSATDSRLSTVYQFNTDLEVGVMDYRDLGIGIGFKHMSNAGLKEPNLGRDFIYCVIHLK